MRVVGILPEEPKLATMTLDNVVLSIKAKVIYGQEMTSQVGNQPILSMVLDGPTEQGTLKP
eukprot:27402-Prorocentrum_minimum.AAC.1